LIVRRTHIATACLVCLVGAVAHSSDGLQRTIAVAETTLPLAFLGLQGTDTTFDYAVFLASIGLNTVPNVVMLVGEATGRSSLTRYSRWFNFGVDAAAAAGLLGVGIAYLAGAFGDGADTRGRGALYLGMSIPAGVAAFSDFLPYAVEANASPARIRNRESAGRDSEPSTPENNAPVVEGDATDGDSTAPAD